MTGRTIEHLDLEEIYSADVGDNNLALLKDKSIVRYRTKTIKSGKILEYEIYPVWNTNNSTRRARTQHTREAQKRLNAKNSVKNVIRLINANFKDGDIWATFTYSQDKLPKDMRSAQKVMANYVRRLKRYAEKKGYPPLKYVYTTEIGDKKKRIHHHIVTNFPDREAMEKLWQGGARKQTRRLQSDEDGFEGLARYITKRVGKDNLPKKAGDLPENCRVATSRNLVKPTVTISESKITRRKVAKLARHEINAATVFDKMSKGEYYLTSCDIKQSEFVSGVYIYAKMKKKE